MKKVGSDDVPVTHGRTVSVLGGFEAAGTAVPVLGAACVRRHRPRARSGGPNAQEIKSERHDDK